MLSLKSLALHVDYLNLFLQSLGVPDKHKPFLIAVIGAGKWQIEEAGDVVITADDYLLARRMRGQRKEVTADSLKQYAYRARREFKEWQHRNGLRLVEIDSGDREINPYTGEVKSTKTRYTVYFAGYFEEVLMRANKYENNKKLMDRAVKREIRKQSKLYKERYAKPCRNIERLSKSEDRENAEIIGRIKSLAMRRVENGYAPDSALMSIIEPLLQHLEVIKSDLEKRESSQLRLVS